jgi:predicted nuclease with RNAse H fold
LSRRKYYAGLDPSASSKKSSGLCIIDGNKLVHYLGSWKTFEELLEILRPFQSQLESAGIDGPLQPPHELGRCCFSSGSGKCGHRQRGKIKGRYCEYLLNKNGYHCFVTSRNSFARQWVYRCFLLNDFLTAQGIATLEVFPYAARRILFPALTGKKQLLKFRQDLHQELQKWGLVFPGAGKCYSHDELDAALAATTVLLHFRHKTRLLGDERDGFICIPSL